MPGAETLQTVEEVKVQVKGLLYPHSALYPLVLWGAIPENRVTFVEASLRCHLLPLLLWLSACTGNWGSLSARLGPE